MHSLLNALRILFFAHAVLEGIAPSVFSSTLLYLFRLDHSLASGCPIILRCALCSLFRCSSHVYVPCLTFFALYFIGSIPLRFRVCLEVNSGRRFVKGYKCSQPCVEWYAGRCVFGVHCSCCLEVPGTIIFLSDCLVVVWRYRVLLFSSV